jgi:predicted amino acid-binding ACT domain protein
MGGVRSCERARARAEHARVLPTPLLLTVTGRDQGGVTAALTGVLMAAGGEVLDLEQVVVRGQLTLCLLVRLPAGGAAPDARVVEALHQVAAERAMTLAVRPMPGRRGAGGRRAAGGHGGRRSGHHRRGCTAWRGCWRRPGATSSASTGSARASCRRSR